MDAVMSECVQTGAIEAPAPTPRASAFRFRTGLRAGLSGVDWKRGIRWMPNPCCTAETWHWYDDCLCEGCEKANPEQKCGQVDGLPYQEAWPFSFYMPDDCDDGVSLSLQEKRARRRQALALSVDKQLAKQLHQGSGRSCDPTPTLQNTAVDISGGAAVDIQTGLGALLNARCVESGQAYGTFFTPDFLTPQIHDLYTAGAGSYQGPGGFPIVTGPGLPNVGPDGAAAGPGEAWIYIAGAVDYAVDEAFDDLDPIDWALVRTNQQPALSEGDAIVRLDPCGVYAVLVKVAPCGCC